MQYVYCVTVCLLFLFIIRSALGVFLCVPDEGFHIQSFLVQKHNFFLGYLFSVMVYVNTNMPVQTVID